MLDRRTFLSSGAAGFAGFVATTPGTGQLLTWTDGNYRGAAFRWWGGSLTIIDRSRVRIGDFLVFAPMRGGNTVGDLDLFICVPAPPGDERETVYMSLGRHADMAAIRGTVTRYIEQIVREFQRQQKLVFPRPAA